MRLARPEALWALLKLAVTRLAYAMLPVCYCICAIKDVAGKSFWRLEIHGLSRQLRTAANSCDASSAVDRKEMLFGPRASECPGTRATKPSVSPGAEDIALSENES